MIATLGYAEVNLSTYWNIFRSLARKRIGRGEMVDRLERSFAEYMGVKHCIATCNGTMADFAMLRTLHEMNPTKKKVMVPALTFPAQINAVWFAGLEPYFVDVEHGCDCDNDFQLDTWYCRSRWNDEFLCIFPAHLLGKACTGVRHFQKKHILEDCCEAMGGELPGGKKLGNYGIAGSYSMFPSHLITCGEGGLIVTDDDDFDEIARSVINHGKWRTNDFDFKYKGMNGKMTDLQAGVALSVIDTIDRSIEIRRQNVNWYNMFLMKDYYATSPHCYPLIYKTKADRDSALAEIKGVGIECRKLMSCLPDMEPYWVNRNPGQYPNANRFANCGLYLPCHQGIGRKEIERICDVISRP